MIVAVDSAGVRRTASPSLDAATFCPGCHRELIVRVPARRVAHFAHRPGQKCDQQALRAARVLQRKVAARAARFAALEKAQTDGQETLFDVGPSSTPS